MTGEDGTSSGGGGGGSNQDRVKMETDPMPVDDARPPPKDGDAPVKTPSGDQEQGKVELLKEGELSEEDKALVERLEAAVREISEALRSPLRRERRSASRRSRRRSKRPRRR